MTTIHPFAPVDVPVPDAMATAGPWGRTGDSWERLLCGPTVPTAVPAELLAVQRADGTTEPPIIELLGVQLTVEQARLLGAGLFALCYTADALAEEAAAEMAMPHGDGYDPSDEAWGDPRWQVDSTTRPCCGAIGGHTRGCPQDLPNIMAAAAAAILDGDA